MFILYYINLIPKFGASTEPYYASSANVLTVAIELSKSWYLLYELLKESFTETLVMALLAKAD